MKQLKKAGTGKAMQANKEPANILNFNCGKAKDFFMKNESYCNAPLPKYFDFGIMLTEIDKYVKDNQNNFDKLLNKSKYYDDVNYKLIMNKDSRYSWRKIELINPILYIELVNKITKESNWEFIKYRIKELQSKVDAHIKCISIPVEKRTEKTDTGASILNYWSNFEQQSIKLSLEYSYIFEADISNFYPSIYTHSIPWAIHSKCTAKEEKFDKNLIGNQIDTLLQCMQYGQTNGIPQGSVLMDFIAEILSAYIDAILYLKLKKLKITKYKILRYRDDYRIFVNNPKNGEQIIKTLSEILMEHGLKLNESKTSNSSDIITNSIKKDKIYSISNPVYHKNIQKHLLNIRELAKKYPNSGAVTTLLNKFFKIIDEIDEKYTSIDVLIAIIVDIAINNSKTYLHASLILSKLLSFMQDDYKKQNIDKIVKKFNEVPNTGYMQVCLQRVVFKIENLNKIKDSFTEKLCQVFNSKTKVSDLWCFDWLKDNKKIQECLIKIINNHGIINTTERDNISTVAKKDEGEIFTLYDY